MISYRYHIIDTQGRLWAKTLTSIKAAKIVRMLKETRGVDCVVREMKGA